MPASPRQPRRRAPDPPQPAGGREPPPTGETWPARERAWRLITPGPGTSAQLRHWIGAAAARHVTGTAAGDAVLVFAELYANAVTHGPGGQILAGYWTEPGSIRIIVCDAGGTPARLRPRIAGPGDEHGRGLQLVAALTAAWGSVPLAGARVAWGDLGRALPAPGAAVTAWLRAALATCPLNRARRPSPRTPGPPGGWIPPPDPGTPGICQIP